MTNVLKVSFTLAAAALAGCIALTSSPITGLIAALVLGGLARATWEA